MTDDLIGTIKEDLERFKKIGKERRQDLKEYIQTGDLGDMIIGRPIGVPIKAIMTPHFEYDKPDMGGVGQGQGGQPEEGDVVGEPEPEEGEEGDEEGEPGEEGGEHDRYQMDPEEFADALDEELDLDLDPKGKKVVSEELGPYDEVWNSGPDSLMDRKHFVKEGLKRTMALTFDEDYVRELMKVDGIEAREVYEEAKKEQVNVSLNWIEDEFLQLDEDDLDIYDSVREAKEENEKTPTHQLIEDHETGLENRPEDEQYTQPEVVEEHQKSVVVVNIRDVSGSMGEQKKELVERTFAPMDYYLRGKYDHAEFVYIAHDRDAWEEEADDFFARDSGGGTQISSAYELAQHILEGDYGEIRDSEHLEANTDDLPKDGYPFDEWNRYVFAAGDSENSSNDTQEQVIPLMEEIDANLHAYIETQPGGSNQYATHAEEVEDHDFPADNVSVQYVNRPEDVVDAIYGVLSSEQTGEE